jgi:ethanolamine ammonia-lyase large subunit
MLSYLTTSFADHLKIRKKFGYKINEEMWSFFKDIQIIDQNNQPTEHFGDPIWVYYQYCKRKKDSRTQSEIYQEGRLKIDEVKKRGVDIAEGFGKNFWDLNPVLDTRIKNLYQDAKESLWTEIDDNFIKQIPNAVLLQTQSKNRQDYVYHPKTGEELSEDSLHKLEIIRRQWKGNIPDVQIIISDGLNAKSLMEDGHLLPFLNLLKDALRQKQYHLSSKNLVIKNGRVRSAYQCGEVLFGEKEIISQKKAIINIIGERPGTEHHNFSAYITLANPNQWQQKGSIDHDITKVLSGISDTALHPTIAVKNTLKLLDQLFEKPD